jgi:prepilin-type N-terminal cleavage/methylation domain-containing protein
MHVTNRRPARFTAFTLIELLVVVAIVAVLAAVLFPVMGHARSMRAGSCLSGNKEINRAFFMYAQDYDDTTVLSGWRQPLSAYVDERRMAKCPNADALPRRYSHDREHEANHRRTSSPNMTYHGGVIMQTSTVEPIFWGPSWASNPGDKMSGLDSFYKGLSGSNYAKASDEYTGSNGQVGPTLTYDQAVIDTSAASGGGNTSAILAEVCRQIAPDPSGNGYYPVYTDVPRGGAGYCAYHSVGTCGGVRVQFGFFWKLDGDRGCDPQDSSGLHSQGLAALANVSAHELSEARTDPASPGAWYDSSGAENGDKCAWTFNVPLVTLSNGTQWKLQGEWSNAAYTAGTGYANSSGQKGCLDGE